MRPLTLALPLAVLLAGCSGTSTPQAASPSPTSSPTPTVVATTPAPTTAPTTAAPTPSATAAGRAKPARDGDVDGDGKADSVRTSATLLTVELSGTGKTVTAPIHAESPSSAPLLGGFDVDRDGYSEIFLETAQGASTTFTTPYRFDGVALRELQLDGGPLRLGIGGSVTHGDGFRCTPDGLLEVRSAESPDGDAFTVQLSVYRLGPRQLVLVRTSSAKANQGDPAVEQSYTSECGPVGEG